MSSVLKIALIEDREELLHQFRDFIDASPHTKCVTAVTKAENFLKYIHNFRDLDIVLLDIDLPGISGIEAIPKILTKLPNVDIIMLTIFNDDETIFQAIRAGATGYLLKTLSQQELVEALLTVKKNGTPISPQIAKKIINYFNPPKSLFSVTNKKQRLTDGEKMVLHHLVRGLSYKEIGIQMDASINTIRTYIKRIYKKLQVNSRKSLIAKYKDSLLRNFKDI